MAITKYNGYSTQELLRRIENEREYSPIIEELAQRLEAEDLHACPVCETDLDKYRRDNT